MTNGDRFINAYNEVDNRLRAINGFSDRMTYSDVVRKSAETNSIVRRYEDELLGYGRLRNAIVHDSFGRDLIAEPNIKVVEIFEHIAEVLSKPPRAIRDDVKYSVTCLAGGDTLDRAIELMYKSGYSVIPVLDGSLVLGVITDKQVVIYLGAMLDKGFDVETSVAKLKLSELVKTTDEGIVYKVLPKSASCFDVLDCFARTRKLRAVLITEDGTRYRKPIKVFTPVDTVELSKILEDYDV